MSSFAELHSSISKVRQYALYRGVSKSSYELVPTLFRSGNTKKGNADVLGDKLINLFKKQSHLLITEKPDNEIRWLVLAQHYGLPTRLLDWSLNPLVAAYFAVYKKPDEDGAIYVYEPEYFDNEEDIKIQGLNYIKAFYPSHMSQRVTAQSGVFTIHPTSSNRLISHKIKKIVIPSELKKEFQIGLSKYGINHAVIFPGLEGVTKKLKFEFGYE